MTIKVTVEIPMPEFVLGNTTQGWAIFKVKGDKLSFVRFASYAEAVKVVRKGEAS